MAVADINFLRRVADLGCGSLELVPYEMPCSSCIAPLS